MCLKLSQNKYSKTCYFCQNFATVVLWSRCFAKFGKIWQNRFIALFFYKMFFHHNLRRNYYNRNRKTVGKNVGKCRAYFAKFFKIHFRNHPTILNVCKIMAEVIIVNIAANTCCCGGVIIILSPKWWNCSAKIDNYKWCLRTLCPGPYSWSPRFFCTPFLFRPCRGATLWFETLFFTKLIKFTFFVALLRPILTKKWKFFSFVEKFNKKST